MQTFISFLRGINVSGQKKILMAELKALYEALKFTEVHTYIQSGNVVFKSNLKLTDAELTKKIEAAIYNKYDFRVPVIIRSAEEFENIISHNPFVNEKDFNTGRLYVTFLSEVPTKDLLKRISQVDYSPDRFIIIGKEVFLHVSGGYDETKISNKLFENRLKVTATTRNWKTVKKLSGLAASS